MLSTILLSLAPGLAPSAPLAVPGSPAVPSAIQEDPEVQKRIAEAGDDVAKLLEVASWCEANDKAAEAREVYKKILTIDAAHEGAHKALRHHFYDGQWFESYVALSKYKREEAQRMKDKGLARYGEEWVPLADVPYLRMGWVKTEDGRWASKHALDRAAQEQKWKDEGWRFRPEDMSWVAPDDVDKLEAGLWKCGEEWLPLDKANEYHSQIGQWWRYQDQSTKRFTVLCTGRHDPDPAKSTVAWAAWYADQAYGDLVRALGITPETPPEVVVLSTIDQYNALAAGDQTTGRPGVESSGASSAHYAYFADTWFDATVSPPEFKGVGVCYWNVDDPNLTSFGKHAVRNAAAQSYMEAVDPSWEAVSVALSSSQAVQPAAFWAEKKIPLWFRYGLAMYCDRFFEDQANPENPWWAREWALANLRGKGELRPLSEIFAFAFDPNDVDGAAKLLQEAGLVVSFVLDGGIPDVTKKHQAFKAALKSGGDTKQAVEELQQVILDYEDALHAHANL